MSDPAARVLDALCCDHHLRRATIYVAPDLTVKASRQRRHDGRDRAATYLVTIGKPNFAERRFIKKALQAHEPFPIKKVQLQYWPTKK